MAFSVRVRCVAGNPREEDCWFHPVWWGARDLKNDPRFRDVSEDEGFMDFGATFDLDEIRELHEEHREDGLRFSRDRFRDVDCLLWLEGHRFDRFVVLIEEWESGLD